MDPFLTACGATSPLTIDVEGPGGQRTERRSFGQPFALIGRDERADLSLDHDLVSRRHTYLQVVDGRVFFVDLDSRSGTIAGGGPVESGWLTPGGAIRIGPYTIRLVDDPGAGGAGGPPPNPLLARSSEAANLPRVSLEFQSSAAGHSVWRMSQVLALLGSSRRCKVRLLDSNVSKLHCALLRTSEGLWAIDLLGRSGVSVNQSPTRAGRLGPGDVLGLGQVVVRPNFDVPAHTGNGATGVWGARPSAPGAGSLIAGGGFPVPAPSDRPARPWGAPAPTPATVGPAGLVPAGVPEWLTGQAPPGPSELAPASGEPALAMLLSHLGQMQQQQSVLQQQMQHQQLVMQQQMIDQFQQSIMMMLQMFTGMHREQTGMLHEQMGLIREEFGRVRELNNEMQEIKAQLAARPAAPPRPMPPPIPPARHVGGPSTNGSPAPNGFAAPAPRPPRPGAPAGPGHAPKPSTPPQGQAANSRFEPPPEPDPAVHDWLNDRLSSLQQEQQTRLQRIMGLIKGGK